MIHQFSKFIFYKLMRWQLIGRFPELKQCVVIVVPHTHWLDFPLGLIVRSVVNQQINYIGKKSLFKPPFGWFFRITGGAPVDRSAANNSVDAVVNLFKQRKIFRFALAPEGTRKKVKALKTGFYYIAKKAQVPIVMVAFDFGKKQVKISEPFETTNDINRDFRKVRKFFEGVQGRVPAYSFGVSEATSS
ncbi:1-acyl-sn-glycerol-3-phosphate acyltransferase [Flagellimonas sp. DF-77]|uniref:1-acyl-sn-glycerol-3-phosphate acyltransferase n=1 Tax=Flagellimonas algarum TaxID=3230298 RepID=UPI003392BD39